MRWIILSHHGENIHQVVDRVTMSSLL